jgi:hypothetical protein
MPDILLITNDELTNKSPLGGNIDVDKYSFIINESQVFVIEPILGTKLYKKILVDYAADTLAGVYEKLVNDYIQPIIICNVSAEFITVSSLNVSNGGVFRYSPQDMESASMKDVEYLANKQRAKADVYIERLQRYLCDGSVDIPEYEVAQDNNYDIRPDRDLNTYGGWRLSGRDYNGTNAEREIWKDILNDEGR